MHRPGSTGTPPMIVQNEVSTRFFETYGARLLAGRLFDPARAQAFAEHPPQPDRRGEAGLRGSVRRGGQARAARERRDRDRDRRGRGHALSIAKDPIDPIAYFQRLRGLSMPVVTLRHADGDPQGLLDRMETIWRRIAPMVPYHALSVDRVLYSAFYKEDAQRSRPFTIGAVLAVVIGCIGLYALAAFDTARRVKEIGIRKTLGASTADVLRLLIGQFLRPVLLANLLAWPIAFVAMRRWLAGFDDRVALSPWFFVGASFVAGAIAIATVFAQSGRVARAEPAYALREM